MNAAQAKWLYNRLVSTPIRYLAGKVMMLLIICVAVPLWHVVMWLDRVRNRHNPGWRPEK